jgi:hypothetical protein
MLSFSRLTWVLCCALLETACAAAGASPEGDDASTDAGQASDATSGGNASDSGASGGRDGSSGTGDASSSGSDGSAVLGDSGGGGPITYALPAPKQCDNQTYVSGCQSGVASSPCGGICSAANACENISQKPGADIGFACPRFMLFADEMLQAAKDDWNSATPPFNYAVAGHDPDTSGIDPNGSTCCQCYQLVFSTPSPSMDVEGCVNANCDAGSAVPVPPPLVVQVFNLGATTQTFDLFMGAGGFGGNDACAAVGSSTSPSGKYLYTAFPSDGEPSGGGVKVSLQDPPWPADCKTSVNYVTADTLGSAACQGQVAAECGKISAPSQSLTTTTVRSCEESNAPASFYHFNWAVYAKKVECPSHMTDVTGCKLAPQGLPSVQPGVTAAQAAADSSWRVYGTTTMQDCCKPSCAWQDNVKVSGATISAVGQYNSFYTCDQNGVPVTE